MLDTIEVKMSIVELRRLGKFNAEWMKPRTLLVSLRNEHEASVTILGKIRERRDWLKQKGAFIIPVLSKEGALKKPISEEKKGIPASKATCREAENPPLGIVQERTKSQNQHGGNQARLTVFS